MQRCARQHGGQYVGVRQLGQRSGRLRPSGRRRQRRRWRWQRRRWLSRRVGSQAQLRPDAPRLRRFVLARDSHRSGTRPTPDKILPSVEEQRNVLWDDQEVDWRCRVRRTELLGGLGVVARLEVERDKGSRAQQRVLLEKRSRNRLSQLVKSLTMALLDRGRDLRLQLEELLASVGVLQFQYGIEHGLQSHEGLGVRLGVQQAGIRHRRTQTVDGFRHVPIDEVESVVRLGPDEGRLVACGRPHQLDDVREHGCSRALISRLIFQNVVQGVQIVLHEHAADELDPRRRGLVVFRQVGVHPADDHPSLLKVQDSRRAKKANTTDPCRRERGMRRRRTRVDHVHKVLAFLGRSLANVQEGLHGGALLNCEVTVGFQLHVTSQQYHLERRIRLARREKESTEQADGHPDELLRRVGQQRLERPSDEWHARPPSPQARKREEQLAQVHAPCESRLCLCPRRPRRVCCGRPNGVQEDGQREKGDIIRRCL